MTLVSHRSPVYQDKSDHTKRWPVRRSNSSQPGVKALVLAFFVVTSMQTVYAKTAGSWWLPISTAIVVALMLADLPKRIPLNVVVFAISQVLLVGIMAFGHAVLLDVIWSSEQTQIVMLLVAGSLVACLYFADADNARSFLPAVAFVMRIEAAISLFFYFSAQSLSLITPTSIKQVNWGGQYSYESVFNLFFIANRSAYGPLAHGRNIGIFVEAPQHAFMLAVAIAVELFFVQRVSRFWLTVLGIAMLTTFSTTGMLLMIGAVVLRVILKRTGAASAIYISVLIPLGVLLVYRLLSYKLDFAGTSVDIRNQNLANAWYAFSSNPLFGVGVKADSWSGVSLGHTSVFSQVLTDGGLLLGLFYFGPILAALILSIRQRENGITSFIILLLVGQFATVMSYTLFAIILLSLFGDYAIGSWKLGSPLQTLSGIARSTGSSIDRNLVPRTARNLPARYTRR